MRRAGNVSEGEGGDRFRLRHRDAATAPEFGLRRPRERPGEFQRRGRPLPHGADRKCDPGRFDEPVRMYKAPPATPSATEEFYETDPKRDFVRGFAIQTVGPLPIAFAKQMMAARGNWGWGMRRIMMDYNHWSSFGLLGEILPWADNRVTLSDDRDQFGLRVAHVNFDLHENDLKLRDFGKKKTEEVMRAAGATEVVEEARFAHLVGAARMGHDPATSVVDKFGRSHDIPNLFVCDGSILPTQGSANPGLTIQALAARTADYLISQGTAIFHSDRRDMTTPPIRPELSPPGTHGPGVARVANLVPG